MLKNNKFSKYKKEYEKNGFVLVKNFLNKKKMQEDTKLAKF